MSNLPDHYTEVSEALRVQVPKNILPHSLIDNATILTLSDYLLGPLGQEHLEPWERKTAKVGLQDRQGRVG